MNIIPSDLIAIIPLLRDLYRVKESSFSLLYQVHHHGFGSHYTYVNLDRKSQINHEFAYNRPLLCYGKRLYIVYFYTIQSGFHA